MMKYLLCGAAVLTLAACGEQEEAKTIEPTEPKVSLETVALTSASVLEADIRYRVKELSDDKFAGRAPGDPLGETAADWIADDMKRSGLMPGNGDSYFQNVEMVTLTLDEAASDFSIKIGDAAITMENLADTVYWTKQQTTEEISFSDSELVFVGYGAVAPEYGWNDYDGIDVTGKTVVMLVNDPGYATGDAELFNGKAMTYYGRWTYKFEEAARQGATAAIVIHETEPASYGWNVVSDSWRGEQADLVRNDAGASRIKMEAWITRDKAVELFDAAGLDFEAMKTAAKTPGFKPVSMGELKASGTINQSLKRAQSRNVVGVVKGKTAPAEYILYMGHWDHLGKKEVAEGEDGIYNGAVDNATGIAMINEIGEAFANGETPDRSIMVLAVTLEESGLLGSAYFGENPIVPLNKIVAGFNIDGVLPIGPTKDIMVVGFGASELEDRLAAELAKTGRFITPDNHPEAGYFYRSDHISLAKKGVPMMYADAGADALDGGMELGEKMAADYRANDYHQPSDEYSESWDLSGMAENTVLFHELGRQIANSEDWPNWYEGNEFKAIRDASMASAD